MLLLCFGIPFRIGGRHAPLGPLGPQRPEERKQSEGDRATDQIKMERERAERRDVRGDRRGGWLARARLSVTSGLDSARSPWNFFIINHSSEAEGKR